MGKETNPYLPPMQTDTNSVIKENIIQYEINKLPPMQTDTDSVDILSQT